MKIDGELVQLVKTTQAKLKGLGKDAKASQVLAVKEEFAEAVVEIIGRAGDKITDAEKIAAFDHLLLSQKAALTEEVNERYRDDDSDHYAYEDVAQAVFGAKIFDATNAFEKLLPKKE